METNRITQQIIDIHAKYRGETIEDSKQKFQKRKSSSTDNKAAVQEELRSGWFPPRSNNSHLYDDARRRINKTMVTARTIGKSAKPLVPQMQ